MATYRDTVLESKYWNHNGSFQNEIDGLFAKLVPASGKCETLEGEMLRAANRLYYDYYNNACVNNTSGAAKFLMNFHYLIENELGTNVENELTAIYHESNACGYTNENLEVELEAVMNAVIEYILCKDGDYTPNEADLFDFQEPDFDEDLPSYYYDEDHAEDEA